MSYKHLVICFMSFLFFGLTTEAATVKSVKGNKVVINLDGDEVSSGDKMFALDSNGKKKGLLKIVKVGRSGKSALATLTKGKAQAGWNVSAASSSSGGSSSGGGGGASSGLHYGVSLGVSLDSMDAAIGGETVKMSGNGFAVKGVADYFWTSSIALRGKLGLETFKVSGDAATAVCSSSTTCNANINFLAVEGLARYIFSSGKYQFWAGAGGAIFNAASQTSNAVQKIGTTGAWQVGGGLDYKLSGKKYLPIEVLYSNLPSSASAKASYISVLVGYVF